MKSRIPTYHNAVDSENYHSMAVPIRVIGNDTELDRLLNAKFTTVFRTSYVEAGEDKVCLPNRYQMYEEKIRNFEVRDDDVFLLGLAKSGTTWCHEMIWLIVNNLDFEGAKIDNFRRSPLLEAAILYDFGAMNILPPDVEDLFEIVERIKSPRCIKSHLNWSLLPEQVKNGTKRPKIILLLRNPKDACVSQYHQAKLTGSFKGTFEEFSDLYLGGRVPFGPFWKYTLKLWNQRNRSNVSLIKYEEMRSDLPGVIRKVAKFLEKTLTDDQVARLAKHLSFENMKHNNALNEKKLIEKVVKNQGNRSESDGDFLRAGKVGDYKSIMTPEIIKKFDLWTEENISGTDFNLFDH